MRLLLLPLVVIVIIAACTSVLKTSHATKAVLLSEPFLQLPTEDSVRVVWFTEFAGSQHTVAYGEGFSRTVAATTTKLSRTREDQNSRVGKQTQDGQIYNKPIDRNIWRHEAIATGLVSGSRVPYRVTSVGEDGVIASSGVYTLTPNPKPNTPLKILLTSDHQLKPMVATNLQKVAENIGRVDGVFMAGDLVNVGDSASEWFDDNRGNAFFPCMQGRGNYELQSKDGNKTVYKGGELIQHAPLFPAIGNHEVMGRFSMVNSLDEQYDDTVPVSVQEKNDISNQSHDPKIRAQWLKDNSYNTDTYEEIFTLPQSSPGGEKYYAVTFGDVRLVVLYATNMWRSPNLDPSARGKYRERQQDFNAPEKWGYGQHIYEPIGAGSQQYDWLQKELSSSDFARAKYKIVMLHYPPHSLGENIVPAYTNPVQIIERDQAGRITAIRYEYPKQADFLIRDVLPLLEKAGVHLVFYGHSHLWNRFTSKSGMHFLESSNVGNSYGAFVKDKQRSVPINYKEEYTKVGNPNKLEPVMPTIVPLKGDDGKESAYIASNDITVFSIFDTASGVVSSYRFDTRSPKSDIVKFDEFKLGKNYEL
ncbi:MAG: metallophosphoesterase [Stigonema ocellatum SAG 48.90 = DSM 106950]|nr:metallophosphoesterase [Stigonema ocellatum SAG 48.90 = DSM 106950]